MHEQWKQVHLAGVGAHIQISNTIMAIVSVVVGQAPKISVPQFVANIK